MTYQDLLDEVETLCSKEGIVGRREEIAKILLAAKAGKHVLLEGPVGVGKTFLARAVANYLSRDFIRVEGDERITENKLIGYWDPPMVLKKGYVEEAFVPGPLTRAALSGGVLFINELNRLPESAQNALLPVMDEGIIYVPHLGSLRARDGFLIIATQNPEESVGVTRLSEALRDRFIYISLGYQPAEEEKDIVMQNVPISEDEAWISVKIVRKTREHPRIKRGASVRASIDIAHLARSLEGDPDRWLKSSLMVLPQRIELKEGQRVRVEQVIEEIVREVLEGESREEFFR